MQGIFLIVLKHWYNVAMEQDFNKKHWSNPCPQYNCRKNNCKCGLRYVNIPAVLGDDSADSDVAPKNGNYCNTIVEYEANGHKYIYSSEGIPVLVAEECDCPSSLSNIVVDLPNGITTYGEGEAPISYMEAYEAFKAGRSIFFVDKSKEGEEAIYTVSAIDFNDSVGTIKVERAGIGLYDENGFWVIQTENPYKWKYVNYIRTPNDNYSTNEINTGRTWIDGSPIYKKTFDVGALPNNSSKTVHHGINSLKRSIAVEWYAYFEDFVINLLVAKDVSMETNSEDLIVTTYSNMSSFTECYVTLYYIKDE